MEGVVSLTHEVCFTPSFLQLDSYKTRHAAQAAAADLMDAIAFQMES